MHLLREMHATQIRKAEKLSSIPHISKNIRNFRHISRHIKPSCSTCPPIARYSSQGRPYYDNDIVGEEDITIPTSQIRRNPPSSDDVFLPRSLIMDKEIITRTSGKRLGYINQLYVDPSRLEVVSVYLRQGMTSIAAANTDHVLVSSLRQIGDVVLVHDESALLDPPADETYGYIKLVGTQVVTEDGSPLGKVRDFVFNPDNGQIVSIRYDALGIPSIPQSLLSCYALNWQDVVAVGPTKTIVRRGAERRAIKENDGWVSEYVNALVNALAGTDEERAMQLPGETDSYRSDPAYAAWYYQHAAEYERYYGQKLPKPVTAEMPPQRQQQQRMRQPLPPQEKQRRRQGRPPARPRALPPPQSVPYDQAVQQSLPTREKTRQYVGSGDDGYYASSGSSNIGGGSMPPQQLRMRREGPSRSDGKGGGDALPRQQRQMPIKEKLPPSPME